MGWGKYPLLKQNEWRMLWGDRIEWLNWTDFVKGEMDSVTYGTVHIVPGAIGRHCGRWGEKTRATAKENPEHY